VKKENIPTHKHITDNKSINLLLYHITDSDLHNISDNEKFSALNYDHKDDYFVFFLLQEGTIKGRIDFKEIEINERTIFCTIPGQVHSITEISDIKGWVLVADTVFVKNEYKDIFNRLPFLNMTPRLSQDELDELLLCISLVNKKQAQTNELAGQNILHDLVSAYIGIMAEIYQKSFPVVKNNRYMEITSHFKTILSANYQTMKRPNQYASRMHISSIYLNEAVKNTTGFSVSGCIQNEIILQAKRLLYYTDLPIKEIALKLGYDDWAYFTRLFAKSTQLTPSQFRKTNLK